jgi:hypothetical protein
MKNINIHPKTIIEKKRSMSKSGGCFKKHSSFKNEFTTIII